jgi:hypothetical protein
MCKKKWTEESIQKEALKYKIRKDFENSSKGAYLAAQRLHILDRICSHMTNLKHTKYTKEDLFQIAIKYKTKIEFIKDNNSAYVSACKLKILDEICSHMKPLLHKPYKKEEIGKEASKYKTRAEFKSKNHSIYKAAKRLGILDEVCSHMPIHIYNKGKDHHNFIWTDEKMQKEALKYSTRDEFAKCNWGAYLRAQRIDMLDEICSHMELQQHKPYTEEELKQIALVYTSRLEFAKGNPSAYTASRKKIILDEVCSHMERLNGTSRSEIELADFIESLIPIERNNRKLLINGPKLEADIFIPSLNIAFEHDGLRWHSELFKESNYHFDKRELFKSNNIELFSIRENEWNQKQEIVKSIIRNKIGKSLDRKYARKLVIKTVGRSEAVMFLENNHLMGKHLISKYVGLYELDTLVSLMGYVKKDNGKILEITRFCSLLNTNVIGGFSRLLKHIEKEIKPQQIQSWVDLRYGTGNSLESLSFKLATTTLGWQWTDFKNAYNRLQCRANMDDRKLSQKAHAEELRWCKIYDAGQALYIKTVDSLSTIQS